VIGYLIKNFAVADIGWGAGFILVTLFCGYLATERSTLFYLVSGLILLWGLRLSIHIFLRNKGKPEDSRYQTLRSKWTWHPYLQTYIKLFLSQACLMFIVSTAIFI